MRSLQSKIRFIPYMSTYYAVMKHPTFQLYSTSKISSTLKLAIKLALEVSIRLPILFTYRVKTPLQSMTIYTTTCRSSKYSTYIAVIGSARCNRPCWSAGPPNNRLVWGSGMVGILAGHRRLGRARYMLSIWFGWVVDGTMTCMLSEKAREIWCTPKG